MTIAIGFLILATVTNAIAMRLNVKRAEDLDELADEVLRDRERNREIAIANAVNAQDNAEAAASLGVFVALNPITRLKAPNPEA